MMQAHFHLAYAPRGAGVISALFYVTAGENVFGWYTGAKDHGSEAAYFALEHYYSTHATAFCRSLANDVYSAWVLDFPPMTTDITDPDATNPGVYLPAASSISGAVWAIPRTTPTITAIATGRRSILTVPAACRVRLRS
jgi:hypothetical protein